MSCYKMGNPMRTRLVIAIDVTVEYTNAGLREFVEGKSRRAVL